MVIAGLDGGSPTGNENGAQPSTASDPNPAQFEASEGVRAAPDAVQIASEHTQETPGVVAGTTEGVLEYQKAVRTHSEGVGGSPEGVRMGPLTPKARELREVLEEAVEAALSADCIILSGGLDTCILAELAAGGLWRERGAATENTSKDGQEHSGGSNNEGLSEDSESKEEALQSGESGDGHRRAGPRIAIQQHISSSTTGPTSISSPLPQHGQGTDESHVLNKRPEHIAISSANVVRSSNKAVKG